jgi:pyridoxine 5-phosphate synthase
MVKFALDVHPNSVTLVPERREEITTEGGLDLRATFEAVSGVIASLREIGIVAGIFLDPDAEQLELAARTGAQAIEIHTGRYCDATTRSGQDRELRQIRDAAGQAAALGLEVHAGHGLNTQNVGRVAAIAEIEEFNIGHSIISRAVFQGLEAAVREMKSLILAARPEGP